MNYARRRRLALACTLWLFAVSAVSSADELRIAAASDLQTALPEIAAQFERQTGHVTRLTFGSSGNFFAQIQNGAPFDIFLSADVDYPRQLERAALGEPDTLYEYATGRIVLWVPKASPVDLRLGLQGLLSPAVRRIAIANPDHAPYGRAAVAALRNAGLFERLQGRLVLGENVSQAAQFVQSGNADAGILALSVARAPALVDTEWYAVIPPAAYPPIEQAAIVLRASRHKAAARAFLQLLRTPATVALLQRFGFDPPRPVGSR